MTGFVERESYKHKMAKQVLKEWLDESGDIEPFTYRNDSVNVILEYPICIIPELGNTWEYERFRNYGEKVPSYKECVSKYNVYPIAIIDIIVVHKGNPMYAIEICNKNPVSKEKLKKLEEFGVTDLFEVNADWILDQLERPKEIKCVRLI